MAKIIFYSIFYQIKASLRVKQSAFFSLVFPIFLFLVFTNLWSQGDEEYVAFLFTGVIGSTIASDGLFAVGPVVKSYYSTGLLHYLRKMPFNILFHFMGLIINRFCMLCMTFMLLSIASYLSFGYLPSLLQTGQIFIGILIGITTFSFVGLSVTFIGLKQESNFSMMNLIYFIVLFTSNAFYVVGDFNKVMSTISSVLPLNPVLELLRTGKFSISLLLWLIIPIILFSFLFKKIKYRR
ncbi:ABC transporter permease [Halosquirtibacter xylanolyticus]|uniref:ABC transporter permease n=1 Tax=Halosquirtibacter xylanolyticus TaxID=3374599 RepID=UPI00374800B6|nr:ABC transporter permease [Prolixibacteraceae bacterium]